MVVAGWDSEIDQTPLARTICGDPTMLYRRLDRLGGRDADACPHRLCPCRWASRKATAIRCRYHGLLVGSDGRAAEMPLKNEPVNRSICVTLFR